MIPDPSLPSSTTTLAPHASAVTGQLGQYKLLKKLGEGAMGAVYLAEDTAVQRQVALKILPQRHVSNPAFVSRFKREIKAVGRLNHPNIVAAYAAGEHGGHHFYVMEYCPGKSLQQIIRQGPVDWHDALNYTLQAATGLKHAHEHGIVHRDVKPDNIFVTDEGLTKLLDLGLSTNLEDAEQASLTQSGVTVGTPDYLSPEQAHGDRDIDGRADIYSLGITLYHLLTGKVPFSGQTAAVVMVKHLREEVPNPQRLCPDIPDALASMLKRMTAKSKTERYQSCAALIADLERLQLGAATASVANRESPSHSHPRLQSPSKRARAQRSADPLLRKLALGVGVLAVLLAGALLLNGQSSTGQPLTVPDSSKTALKSMPRATPSPESNHASPADLTAPAPKVATPVVPGPQLLDMPKTDDRLEKVFSQLQKTLPTQPDKSQQLAALDAFLKECSDENVALRARALRNSIASTLLERPKPAPARDPAVDVQGALQKAVFLSEKGQFAAAVQVLDEAIKNNARHPALFQNRAATKHSLGDIEGVLQDVDQAISLGARGWNTFALRAVACFGLRRDDDHDKAFQQAVSLSGKTRQEIQERIGPDAIRARALCDGKKFETQAPTTADEFLARAGYRHFTNRPLEAIEDLKEALKRDPSTGPRGVLQKLAEAFRQQKQYKETLAYFKQWSECKPESAEALNAYAWELLNSEDPTLRNPKRALPAALRASELTEHKNSMVLDTLALAYFENGRLQEALKTAETALSLLPSAAPQKIREEYQARLQRFKAAAQAALPHK